MYLSQTSAIKFDINIIYRRWIAKNCDKNISWLFFFSGIYRILSRWRDFIPRTMSRIIKKKPRNALYLFDIVSPCNPADMNTYLVLHIYRHYCTCADRPLCVKHKTMNSNQFTFMWHRSTYPLKMSVKSFLKYFSEKNKYCLRIEQSFPL